VGLLRRPVVLDGELVAGQGRASDFYSVPPNIAARSRRAPLTFVAFDVLAYDGEPVIGRPYARRRALLDGLALNGESWCTTPVLNGSVVDVLAVCGEHDIEGIVSKRVESPYRPGERSSDWVKVKTAEWKSVHADRRHDH
jgi:bifunctional non-homologous end joining protein LigD